MRLLSVLFLTLLTSVAFANPPHSGARPDMATEWNNALPEQRQALDNFYQSLQQTPQSAQSPQLSERLQHLEQLRGMSTEQRQELFRNFVREADARSFR